MGTDVSPSPPSPKMTGVKVALSYGFAVVFDFLKLIFNFLIFTGPYIAGKAAEAYASSQGLPDWLSSTIFYLVGGSTAAAEIFVPQIAFLVGALGAILATVIGIMGSLFMFIWFLLVCRIPLWRRGGSALGWMGFGFILSLIPFVNMFFPQTIATAGIVAAQRKADRAERKKWDEAQAAQQKQKGIEEQGRVQAVQQAQIAQAEQQALILEAEAVAAKREQMQALAANQNEAIPEDG